MFQYCFSIKLTSNNSFSRLWRRTSSPRFGPTETSHLCLNQALSAPQRAVEAAEKAFQALQKAVETRDAAELEGSAQAIRHGYDWNKSIGSSDCLYYSEML